MVYFPTFTIKINHSCRYIYQSHGSYGNDHITWHPRSSAVPGPGPFESIKVGFMWSGLWEGNNQLNILHIYITRNRGRSFYPPIGKFGKSSTQKWLWKWDMWSLPGGLLYTHMFWSLNMSEQPVKSSISLKFVVKSDFPIPWEICLGAHQSVKTRIVCAGENIFASLVATQRGPGLVVDFCCPCFGPWNSPKCLPNRDEFHISRGCFSEGDLISHEKREWETMAPFNAMQAKHLTHLI